jgi:hypothetical protein
VTCQRRPLKPGKRREIVVLDALPAEIQISKIVLRSRFALIRRKTIPFRSLGAILRHA